MPALMQSAKANGFPAIALTDTHNLFGSLEFSQACFKAGIQPIIGCQFHLLPMQEGAKAGEYDQLLLLAKDEMGYQHLMKLVSLAYMEAETPHAPLISLTTLARYAEGLIALSGGIYGAIGKALLRGNQEDAYAYCQQFKDIFPSRFYLEIMRHGLPEEQRTEPQFLHMAIELNLPIVATNDAYFIGEDMHEAHDALICIAEGRYITEEDRRRLTVNHRLKTAQEMATLFADLPEAIENTYIISERCAVASPTRKPMLPSFTMEGDGVVLSEAEGLRKAAEEGLEARLRQVVWRDAMSDAEKETIATPYRTRLAYELDVIISMGFPGYFLIVSDFITWSKQQGIPVGPGRGSGAASVVAWSLLITDLDPLAYDLVFERFLNPERVSMPDFDIDFCQDRRDEVIAYVQRKYGRDKVAQIITFGKLQARAVLRDVGRVLQMPYGQVDKICKLVPANPANPVTLQEAIDSEPLLKEQMREDESVKKLIDIGLKLEGLYRHASTHAAGVVIADRPLDALVPLYRDPKSDMPVVQYSMKYVEEAGLVKFDFLGLKTLSVLAKTVTLIKGLGDRVQGLQEKSLHPTPYTLDLTTIPLHDPATYALLAAGNTVGVFQFESVGMRDALRKLQPDRLEDLIALGALYRPGPMDNIPTYIACKHGREQPNYLHPSLEPVLKETYGVIIYQEQVQKIAQVLSGYTLGGADLLRRAMGKKIKAEMDAQRKIFVDGATANNVSTAQANDIFDLVAKFAGYGFNKAHAAAYALIGYQTAYLKANYPYAFFAASMSYDMHNTDKLAIFKQDMEAMGLRILPPDINASQAEFCVEVDAQGNSAVRYALAALKNVGEQAMEELVAERARHGTFTSIYDVMERLDTKIINKRSLENLIMSGACDGLHPNRAQLFASIDMLLAYAQHQAEERASTQTSLFGEESGASIPPPALSNCPEWESLDRLTREYQAIGFYLSSHPLDGYRPAFAPLNIKEYATLPALLSDQYRKVTLAGIIMGRKLKTSPRGRFAFVQLSDASAVYEATLYDETVLDNSRHLLEAGQMVLVQAEAKSDDAGGVRIIIQSLTPLEDSLKNYRHGNITNSTPLTLTIRTTHAVEHLKSLLPESSSTGQSLIFRIPLDETRHAIVQSAGRYAITPDMLLKINQSPDISLA
jgi:DNA polymerase-3 subunit alpha